MATSKLCPRCKFVYGERAEVCERCGGPLTPLTDPDQLFAPASAPGEAGHLRATYLLAALVPILGLILAAVYGVRRDKPCAKGLLLTALGGAALYGLLLAAALGAR